MNGTIPTLVVPTIETTGDDVDTRYRSLRDTVTICEFLDQARSANTSRTLSDKPAPALGPATIEGKSLSDTVIELVHLPTVDPNFVALAAKDSEELKAKAAHAPGQSLTDRRTALHTYLAEAKKQASESSVSSAKDGGLTYEQKLVQFLEEKVKSNDQIWELYNGKAGSEREKAFFEISAKTWSESLPGTFAKLDSLIKGPYILGDQVSLADLHVVSWITRLVSIAGGKPDASGISSLETASGKPIGEKLRKFWELWVERDSFQQVLVPACSAFAEMR
ncbi:hypothetical protein IAT38_001277 [Cryptococcus sp. DSM 104549]